MRASSTSLRHGRTHRAKIKAAAANLETVVHAEFNASTMDVEGSAKEAAFQIYGWIRAGARNGYEIRRELCVSRENESVRIVAVFVVKGPVTLPTAHGHWKIAKATPEQEAWARRKATQ